jgi:hypothetical protein
VRLHTRERASERVRAQSAAPVHPRPRARVCVLTAQRRAAPHRARSYERNYPVYQGKLATPPSSGLPGGNASAPEVVTDPAATIYIIEGCAGDVEHHEPFTRPQPAYSAYRSNTYGYGRMTVYNASHMLWEQRQTDNEYPTTTGTVIDAMLIVRTH